MIITKFALSEALEQLPEPVAVARPLGAPHSQVRSVGRLSATTPGTKIGYWECTPGRWERQVLQAEFCHFLSGKATFTPEGGETVAVEAGDFLHFPENSCGIWDIVETTTKIFMVYDLAASN